MNDLTIVGMGPGSPELLTREAAAVLENAVEVNVSDDRHPVARGLAPEVLRTLGRVGGVGEPSAEDIAQRIVVLACRPEGVTFAVPGHPLVANSVVSRILNLAKAAGVKVRIVAGLSSRDLALHSLDLNPTSGGYQVLDAVAVNATRTSAGSVGPDPYAGVYRAFDPNRPLLVGGFTRRAALADVGEALLAVYPPDHQVQLVGPDIDSAAMPVAQLPLAELATRSADDQSWLYVPPLERLSDAAGFDTLRYIVARLRAPAGCPWDREQTYQTIKKHLIEETYEAVAAIDENDYLRFAEELGDVLLQVVMYSQLAREAGDFALEDVLRAVNLKLIRRHPHVFGDLQVASSADVLRNWERIKRAEKNAAPSTFGGVPEAAPALMRADAVQSRATRYGWLPPTPSPELDNATRASGDPANRLRAIGDVLFELVTLARRERIDPEEALRLATNRFRDGFDQVLRQCESAGVAFESLPADERNRLLAEAIRTQR